MLWIVFHCKHVGADGCVGTVFQTKQFQSVAELDHRAAQYICICVNIVVVLYICICMYTISICTCTQVYMHVHAHVNVTLLLLLIHTQETWGFVLWQEGSLMAERQWFPSC